MRSREVLIVGVVIIVTVAVLAVLYTFEKGQRIIINQSLTTSDGIKLTVHEGRFRSIDPAQTDLILKATAENTTTSPLTPSTPPQINSPVRVEVCSTYNNGYVAPYQPSCVAQDSQEYKDYLSEKAKYDAAIAQFQKEKRANEVQLLTPRNSTATSDYARIGGEQDLKLALDSEYRTFNPNESIDGILVFNVNPDEKGSYVLKYKGQQLTFKVDNK